MPKGPLRSCSSNLLAGTPLSRSRCSKAHPAWPWTSQAWERPQPLWTIVQLHSWTVMLNSIVAFLGNCWIVLLNCPLSSWQGHVFFSPSSWTTASAEWSILSSLVALICRWDLSFVITPLFYHFRVDDDETYCRAVTEYARACSHAGSPVRDWRDDFPACSKRLFSKA